MSLIWTLAKKEFLLLVRDRLALFLLLLMPLLFIAILGLLLGEGFGQMILFFGRDNDGLPSRDREREGVALLPLVPARRRRRGFLPPPRPLARERSPW